MTSLSTPVAHTSMLSSSEDDCNFSTDMGSGGGAVVAVDSDIYQDPRWCPNCAGRKTFIEVFRFDTRRLICCQGCGEEWIVQYDRTNSEVV